MPDKKVVTIVGRGDSWIYCPFEGEVWGVSSVLDTPILRDKHFDKLFAFDNLSKDITHQAYKLRGFLKIAEERGIPVVSTQGYATERYPLLEMFREFNVGYFTPTISYMLALAIYKGYEPIHIFGIDQDSDARHIGNRRFVDFWLGVMVGRGIRYTIANRSFVRYMPTSMENIVSPPAGSLNDKIKEWKNGF